MNAEEIRDRRTSLGFTLTMLAEVLHVDTRELRDWESGAVSIPDWVTVSMNALTVARAKPDEDLLIASGTFASRRNKLLWSKVREAIAVAPPEKDSSRRS